LKGKAVAGNRGGFFVAVFMRFDVPSSQAESKTPIDHQGHQVHQALENPILGVLGALGG
jgi:hypothetical protein